MPRRRPPGAGLGIKSTTTWLAALLVLPWISTAAQQQLPSDSGLGNSPLEDPLVDITPHKPHKANNQGGLANASKRSTESPLLVQHVSAVATRVPSAPADAAVRAPSTRNAAPSGGLSRPRARNLQDWDVEDFVLLATVDGRIHARDRYNGDGIWELDLKKPMLETIYHRNESESDRNPHNKSFMWIVEPKEDGPLYILTPGPQPVLQSLGMTVKQLTEDLAPFSDDVHSVVYTAEKKNLLFVVDARTGQVTKSFTTGGAVVVDTESCVPQISEYFTNKERECRGLFNIGQTEYTIAIHNKNTGEHVCTIKYSEWTPNNGDRDLQAQYRQTMDNQYIYSRFDGRWLAFDHNRSKKHLTRPRFEHKLSSPVVRVFDVASPSDNEDPQAPLVLLPQPPGPYFLEEKLNDVWLNTTETGSWYALSEANYPAVTDSAPQALCYSTEWSSNDLLNLDTKNLPDRSGLVGVHVLDYQASPRQTRLAIEAPHTSTEAIVPRPELPPTKSPIQVISGPPAAVTIESRVGPSRSVLAYTVVLVMFIIGGGYISIGQPKSLGSLKSQLSRLSHPGKAAHAEPIVAASSLPTPPPEQVTADPPTAEATTTEAGVTLAPVEAEQEKKVRFEVPDEEEEEDDDELEPLSRTTTTETIVAPNEANEAEGNAATKSPSTDAAQVESTAEGGVQGQNDGPATPAKKKKTHRGKRGGQKKPRKLKDEDEIDRAVNAAKELDRSPPLHPDEVTANDDDVEDISNIKKIGKLTIDCDRLLGNGSGGTFVFEGKWNEREVAIKRMLPQYFGLAEQEVKLLQESDLHPNVIRYFDDEKDENFLYIAVELCQASLFDLYRDGAGADLTDNQHQLVNEINADVPRALYQLALGVNHLHSLRIIHRDIKPQNILIAYPQRNQKNGPRLVISDFGLCKTLPDNVSTLIGTTGNAGTVGWKAPELILQPKDIERGSSTGHSRDSSNSTDPVAQGVKRAVDIFSLGCVFFYVLTNGSHPFDDDEGWMQIRELNIKKNKANFKQLNLGDDSEEPIHLISWMLSNRPEDRPTAIQVMNHPFFWSAEKRLNFLCDCSDHWEREPRDPASEHLSILEDYSYEVLDKKRNFLDKLDRGFVNSLGKQRKYTGDRMLDLLRALRNKKNHYEDMEESVKAKVGPLPHGYLRYWTTKFPKLIMSCYESVVACELYGEPRFKPYFENLNAV